MLRTIRIALFTLACCGIAASAQTTYSLVPGQCGLIQPTLACIIDMSPVNPLGIYPTMRLYGVNYTAPVEDTGTLEFSTTQGPSGGYLGSGYISLSAPTGTDSEGNNVLTVYFVGDYAPASGGGPFQGFATIHWTTTTQTTRYGKRTYFVVVKGAVTIY